MREAEANVEHVIEQMDSALAHASRRFAEGASADEALAGANSVFGLVVDLPVDVFLTMSPSTMLSLLEMSGVEDRVLAKVAEALLLHAEMLEAEGEIIEAGARREQAEAIMEFIDPARAN